MRAAPRGRLPVRPTVALVGIATLALVATVVVHDPATPVAGDAPGASEPAELDLDPELVAAALERIESIEQPLATWFRLADCESGEWDADAFPIIGSADWTHGADEDTRFEGGLHFEPSTWDAFRDPGMVAEAGDAAPLTQVVVAERVLDAQGWEAWPVCSRKLALR